jgi:hypothetical protein
MPQTPASSTVKRDTVTFPEQDLDLGHLGMMKAKIRENKFTSKQL